jgi:hypothetical protein
MPAPVCAPDVLGFFRLSGQPCWRDARYDPAEPRRMVVDVKPIERASLARIKTMLTHCVRGERFCDGHWDAMLRSCRITAILRRLAVLRESL